MTMIEVITMVAIIEFIIIGYLIAAVNVLRKGVR